MIEAQLPIGRTFLASYRDWRRLLVVQRVIVLCGLLIIVAISALAELVPHTLWEQNLAGSIFDLLDDAVWALLLTPVVIAVHRFVIQDIITSGYALPLGDPAYRRFIVWLFALKVLAGLPLTLLGAMQMLDWPLLVSTAGFAVVLALRLTILLPAIAVQAQGAVPALALTDTRDQALRIFALFVFGLAPWAILDIAVVLVLGRGVDIVGSPRAMIDLLATGITQTITLTLSVTIASHVFLALGNAVKRAPKLALKHPLSKHHSPR